MKLSTSAAVVAVLGALASAPAHAAAVLIDLTPGNNNAFLCASCDAAGVTFGYEFTVTAAVSVDGLGFWDVGSDGIGRATETGLWDAAGNLLASAAISDQSDVVGSSNAGGNWLFEDIAALTLGPGTYHLGSLIYANQPIFLYGPGGINGTAGIAVGSGLIGTGVGLADPTFADPNQIVGPTLRGSLVNLVPEPDALALVGVALAALCVARRRTSALGTPTTRRTRRPSAVSAT